MHTIPLEISPPKNEADFERMCAHIYGVVFGDRTPRINGRRGQAQGGVDIFVKELGVGRVGIQCKKFTAKAVTWKDVTEEVEKADKQATPIKKLLLATTAPNDAALARQVMELSDEREERGAFPVEIDFWEDICLRIEAYPILQDSYAPSAPGAAYYRQEAKVNAVYDVVMRTEQQVIALGVLPPARHDSTNKLISDQLDHVNGLLKASKYQDATAHLLTIGGDLEPFDQHQRARWYLQRGLAAWLGREGNEHCAELFFKAYALYPDDERITAAHVRALLMDRRVDDALAASLAAVERYPASLHVWLVHANARLVAGQHLTEDDVPADFRSEPDALQLLAQSEEDAGNLDSAVRWSRAAAALPGAAFFTRAAALQIAAVAGATYPNGASFGAIPTATMEAIAAAVAHFEPRHDRLWSVQSSAAGETAAHLGFAFLMLNRREEALEVAREAKLHGHDSPQLLHLECTALFELQREADLLSLAASRLHELPAESLLFVGQVAARTSNLSLLERAQEALGQFHPDEKSVARALSALRWEGMFRDGDGAGAVAAIRKADLTLDGSLIECCVASRILLQLGHAENAEAVMQRAQSLVTPEDSAADRLMLAELLFKAKRWTEAAELYQALAAPGRLSDLNDRLLECYIRSHNRGRAKELISNFPAGWIESEQTRHLAIDLGQDAGDWAFLEPLAEAQVRQNSDSAAAWLLKLQVSLRASSPPEFQDDLRTVPERLEGKLGSLVQLARLEIHYGEARRGMRRLYRMVRSNLDDPEALSRYFLGLVGAPRDLPMMDESLPAVAPGTAIELTDDDGLVSHFVVDPDDVGPLPAREGFLDVKSPLGKAVLNSVKGQKVSIPMRAFGDSQEYTVTSIQSAYRRLSHLVQERAAAAAGLPHMRSVRMGEDESGAFDLSEMRSMMRRSTERAQEIFDAYATGNLTLAAFSDLQGRHAVDAVIGWPEEAPSLFVSTGQTQERNEAATVIARSDMSYIIDSATLAELTNLGLHDALPALPKVYVSAHTKALLADRYEEALHDRSVATSAEIDGELRIFELTEAQKTRRTKFFKTLLDTAEEYCEVLPVYGDPPDDSTARSLLSVLCDEEKEVLLLARERSAAVLTLDGKFRQVLKVAGIPGIWPQLLAWHAHGTGRISQQKVAASTVQQFLTNRTFVALSAYDLVWMVHQGGTWLQLGLRKLKSYLSSKDSEFASTARVALEFLAMLASRHTQRLAFTEIFSHVVEALLRHPDADPGFEETVTEFIAQIGSLAGNEIACSYPAAQRSQEQLGDAVCRMLAECYVRAKEKAELPATDEPVSVEVLYCSQTPFLRSKPQPDVS